MQTIVVNVLPAEANTGIVMNHILASPKYVVRGDSNVTLRDGGNYAFTVEHPLAALRICGIHDALVDGIEQEWDFSRPQHRAAYSLMLKPSAVLGGPDGTISGGLVELTANENVFDTGAVRDEKTIDKDIVVTTEDGGRLEIRPARKGTGLDIELYLASLGPLKAIFDPESGLPAELRSKVGKSVTAFIKGPNEDSLYHALGDLIGDLAGIGGIDDAIIRAKFMRNYHLLTMNAVRKMQLAPA